MLNCVSKKMRLVGVWSDNIKPLYCLYMKSLKKYEKAFSLNLKKISLKSFESFGFGTPSWFEAGILKLDWILENLNNSEKREIIVFNDVDIQYLNPMNLFNVVNIMDSKKLDFCGIMEHNSAEYYERYNGGYYLLRNTPEVKSFINNIKNELKVNKPEFADQDILNDLIHHAKIKHEFMPEEFFINGPHAPITQQAIMHHAIFVGCLRDKLAQLKRIYIEYHTAKYSDPKSAVYGREYGEINTKNEGFKLANGLWLNNPFATKLFL